MIIKGDVVKIRPEWSDPGDQEFTWVAVDNEDKGRVTITPVDIGLTIRPQQVVDVETLEA